jgi:hypothetical protein
MRVHFAPKADKRADVSLSPLRANNDRMRCSKEPLFDHLVGVAGTTRGFSALLRHALGRRVRRQGDPGMA